MSKLSIVIPVYYNEKNLHPLYDDIKEKIIDVIDYDYEIVFVDDGSEDDSWRVINELAEKDKNIVAIKLSRNFGSHSAILCGLSNSTGDCAVVKAADLQEPSETILKMYDKWKEGNNVVLATRAGRADKSFFSEMYYAMVRKVALPKMPKHGFDTFLVDRKVIAVLEQLNEPNSALTGQVLWSGFKTAEVEYERQERKIGKSRWTLKKKIRLVMDTLFNFSTLPITFTMGAGILSFAVSVIWGIVAVCLKLFGKVDTPGYTTLMIVQLLSFGIIMMSIGIIGNYLWRTFDASRKRPPYIIEEKRVNEEENKEEQDKTDGK